MSKRHKRRSPRGQGGGFGKTKSWAAPDENSTLDALIVNLRTLKEPFRWELLNGYVAVTAEAHLILTAIRDICGIGPKGQRRFDQALRRVVAAERLH